ncbi:MAG: hypothetical protein KJ653_01845, partial [Candidatus Thermoplasmatota archaeon]|nr:hypothetical protein [Candidatus Thermoplasmatota archaeon]
MPQVSVGQVENIEDACDGMTRGCEEISGGVEGLLSHIVEKVAEVSEEERQSSTMLETAAQEELMTARALQEALSQVAAARADLEAARAAMSSCESQACSEDGSPPDCSSEAWAVDSAEAGVSAAEANAEQTADEHQSAKEHRMHMEQRLELTHRAALRVAHLEEAVQAESALRLGAVQAFADTGHVRLSQAREALESYLMEDPVAAQFATWVYWSPSKSALVSPGDLSLRMSLSSEQQRHFVAYLADRDPAFRSTLAGYKEELSKCQGAAERHAVQLKVRRNLAGSVAERMV